MADQMGWHSYGDKQYVPHVLCGTTQSARCSTPRRTGMLIFFDWAPQDEVPDYVGIVEKVENGMAEN